MKISTLSFAIVMFSMAAFAEDGATQARDGVVDKREQIQEKRIEQGVQSGELTPGEAHRLERQQDRIERAEGHAMKDGKMSRREFRRIERMQNRANANIFNKKHNARKAR